MHSHTLSVSIPTALPPKVSSFRSSPSVEWGCERVGQYIMKWAESACNIASISLYEHNEEMSANWKARRTTQKVAARTSWKYNTPKRDGIPPHFDSYLHSCIFSWTPCHVYGEARHEPYQLRVISFHQQNVHFIYR